MGAGMTQGATAEENGAAPAEIAALALERGYWNAASLPYGHTDLLGDGDCLIGLVRDLPSADAEFPAITHHALSVPLDVEVYKRFAWDDLTFSGQLRRGDISIIPAGLPSRIQHRGRYSEALHVFVRPAYLQHLAATECALGENDARVLPTVLFRDTWLTELANRIRDEIVGQRPGGRLVAESLATAFFIGLIRLLAGNDGRAIEPIKSDSRAHGHVRRATEYMHSNLDRDIGLSELAASAGCSLERLKQAFREHVGEPPYRYLLRMRIEKARHLLVAGDDPISSVAALCGFNNQAHFTTAFARIVGMPPAKWRRQA